MSPRHPREHAASAVQRLTGAVRDAILDGDLDGDTRLVEQRLAAGHGAARHTVRAALRQLAAEGLVVVEPHRGARVARLDDLAAVGLYELRAALEVEGARLALERHGGRLPAGVHDAAAALAAACAAPGAGWAAVTARHGDLHHAIVAASRSERIARAHAALEAETRLFLLQVRGDFPLDRLAADHLRLVADLERDGAGVLRAHLHTSITALLSAQARPGTPTGHRRGG